MMTHGGRYEDGYELSEQQERRLNIQDENYAKALFNRRASRAIREKRHKTKTNRRKGRNYGKH